MKKLPLLLICLVLLSCKAKDTTNNSGLQAAAAAKVESNNSGSQNDVVSTLRPGSGTADSTTGSLTPGKVDLDLTKMSSTMIYTTIFDMLIMPEDYVEKNIKVKGWFETYTDPYTAELYYAVVVPDATACCQQGLEFILKGTQYPDGYPDIGADFTVQGTFERYMEGDQPYYHLIDAELC